MFRYRLEREVYRDWEFIGDYETESEARFARECEFIQNHLDSEFYVYRIVEYRIIELY